MNKDILGKYAIVTREVFSSSFVIKILEDESTMLLELAEDYYPDDITNQFDYASTEYFWQSWASKERFKSTWLEPQLGDSLEWFDNFDETMKRYND